MNFTGYTEEEMIRWLWLRAVEWESFPAFISQPIAPILFIFFPWYYVLLVIFVLGVLWCFIRYSFVSVTAAAVACMTVIWLKWLSAIGSSIYLFIHHQIVAGIVALLWPLLAGLVQIPGKAGVIQLAFAKKIGFSGIDDPSDQASKN